MVIGFLGKGGSGKSTLSTLFTLHLSTAGKKVLAVDADHNMDLSYNLGVKEEVPYVGQGLRDLLSHLGISNDYREAFFQTQDPVFTLTPSDAFTKSYTVSSRENVSVMIAGPHTNTILHDQSCSHSLITPLKVYLPFLMLQENEWAVVDEKAGLDGVGTGITTGFDVAVVVSEPTEHSLKTAQEIIKLLEFYETPYLWVLNKVTEERGVSNARVQMHREPDAIFGFVQPDFKQPAESTLRVLGNLHKKALEKMKGEKSRKERSKEKFTKNKEFETVSQ